MNWKNDFNKPPTDMCCQTPIKTAEQFVVTSKSVYRIIKYPISPAPKWFNVITLVLYIPHIAYWY